MGHFDSPLELEATSDGEEEEKEKMDEPPRGGRRDGIEEAGGVDLEERPEHLDWNAWYRRRSPS